MVRTQNTKPHPITTNRVKASDGLAVAPLREGDVLLSEMKAREMLGGASHMTFRRRLAEDPTFPRLVRIGRRRFYWRNDVLRWVHSDAAARSLPHKGA
jgi:predicted DNA-binding transcriptional regulator AlpA